MTKVNKSIKIVNWQWTRTVWNLDSRVFTSQRARFQWEKQIREFMYGHLFILSTYSTWMLPRFRDYAKNYNTNMKKTRPLSSWSSWSWRGNQPLWLLKGTPGLTEGGKPSQQLVSVGWGVLLRTAAQKSWL